MLAAPVLHRLHWRFRAAVESASVTPAVRGIGEQLERLEIRLGPGGPNLSEVAAVVVNHQVATDARLERIEETLRAIASRESLDAAMARLERQFQEALPVRFDALRIGLDAARLDGKAAERAVLDGLNRAHVLLEATAAAQENALQAGLDHAHRLLEAAGVAQRDLVDEGRSGRAEFRDVTNRLTSRVNVLLQRVAIPLGKDVLVRTPDGFLLTPAEDPALLAALHESAGQLEPGTVSVIRALLREGDVAVDVGANIGMTVLPAALRVGSAGHVIAFEAASRVGGLLRRSLALNGVEKRVTLHSCAAGEADGRAVLNLGAVSGHSSLLPLPGAERTEEVEVRTLDGAVAPGQRVRLAKLDAEGFELQVWRGMRRVVTESPDLAVLVEFGPEHLRRAGVGVEEWLAEFLAPGFTAHEVEEATGRLRPLRPAGELADVFSLNLLLLRQSPETLPELDFA